MLITHYSFTSFINLSRKRLRLWPLVVVFVLFQLLLKQGFAQDLGINTDLQDSDLSFSLSTSVDYSSALGGTITVDQYGLYNTTNISQAGSNSNTISVSQQGNNNNSDIIQNGIGNNVSLVQEGENNLFKIIQDGNDNTANVNQLGEQTFVVRQIGNEMVVNITQYKN